MTESSTRLSSQRLEINGIVIWTSLRFELGEIASAWMDNRFMDKCKEEDLIVTLVRKESWRLVEDPKLVHEIAVK